MTTTLEQPAMTDRTLPAPWGLCDICGKEAGLLGVGKYAREHLCPECLKRNTLQDAAQQQLEDLIAPVLGAWAAQWTRAGLSVQQLEWITEMASGAWMHDQAARTYRTATVRRLARLYAAPAFKRARPDRVTLNLAALPVLSAYVPADPAQPGRHRAYFTDLEGRAHSLLPGLDVLTLTLPDGWTAVLYTGRRGHTDFDRASTRDVPGFRVPAELLPHVRAALEPQPRL